MIVATKVRSIKVSFHFDTDGDVFAYFPSEPADNSGNFLSYARIGQHSACSPTYVKECGFAEIKDYTELLNELKTIGYCNLIVLNEKQ